MHIYMYTSSIYFVNLNLAVLNPKAEWYIGKYLRWELRWPTLLCMYVSMYVGEPPKK